jgi:hypothetical protein
MTCTHHLFGGPLICTRTDVHVTGHIYVSTSSPDDKHEDGGHG